MLIGDVNGHGIASALVTGSAAGAAAAVFDQQLHQNLDPEKTLEFMAHSMNTAIKATGNKSGRLMSMAFVSLNTISGDVHYLNAGHFPVFIKRSNGVEVLVGPGSFLGSQNPKFYSQKSVLSAGDMICLFTDGFEENKVAQGRPLNIRRMKKLIETSATLGELSDRLKDHANHFIDDPHTDDSAFLLVQLRTF